jgi:hypothetical protein
MLGLLSGQATEEVARRWVQGASTTVGAGVGTELGVNLFHGSGKFLLSGKKNFR